MGIKDRIAALFNGGAHDAPALELPVAPAAATEALPAVVDAPAAAPAQMGFMEGADGQRALPWKNYNGLSFTAGYSPYYSGPPGSEVSRERAVASAVTLEQLNSNTVIATLVENLTTQAIGNGLTLSSKPDHVALGITAEQSRDLSHQIERAWLAWCNNALEADASGRHTLHQLATAAYKSYLTTGEAVVALIWRRNKQTRTATKVRLLDSRQIDQSITRVTDTGSVVQGVDFDKGGRLRGFWIRKFPLGQINYQPLPEFVDAYTPWGCPRVLHLFDLILPGQLRGVPPLIAALTPAQGKAVLREYTMAGALVQSMFCATVESDLPNALKGLDSGDGGIVGFDAAPKGTDPQAWLAARQAFYGEKGISLNPAQVNHLALNDKLKIHRSETPNSTYQSFDMSLNREAAKAAGASYEDVSGDFSQTSFAASRLALDLPSRINDRRRASIAVRFYQGVFRAWLEEACETGTVKLPKGAPAFWEDPDAYSQATWRGKGKAVADPLKQAQADILEIENGLSTIEDKLAERGQDFEEVVAQRKAEREQLEAAGLNYPVPKNRDDWQPEEDTPQPVRE